MFTISEKVGGLRCSTKPPPWHACTSNFSLCLCAPNDSLQTSVSRQVISDALASCYHRFCTRGGHQVSTSL
eukprot:874371-Amphidinium_carterae.1